MCLSCVRSCRLLHLVGDCMAIPEKIFMAHHPGNHFKHITLFDGGFGDSDTLSMMLSIAAAAKEHRVATTR